MTKAEAETVVDKAYNFGATSEANAYVHAAIAAAQSGNTAEAINQLKTYARALKDGHAASQADNSAVEVALKTDAPGPLPQAPGIARHHSQGCAKCHRSQRTRKRGFRRSRFRIERFGSWSYINIAGSATMGLRTYFMEIHVDLDCPQWDWQTDPGGQNGFLQWRAEFWVGHGRVPDFQK